MKHVGSVFAARAYIDGLVDRPKATASELFFRQIDRLLSGRMLCSEQRCRLLAFYAQLAERRERVPALFKVGVAVRLILSLTRFAVWPLDLEDQFVSVFF